MNRNLGLSLFTLRLGVFVVMFVWTLDKFVNPAHTAKVFAHFYKIPELSTNMAYLLGVLQMVIVLAFLAGIKKRWSYGLVLLMHGVATVTSIGRMLDPWTFPNLLFLAALPMLAACFTLYLMRDEDTMFTLSK